MVVGAGILGLATAAELLSIRPGWKVAVLEKEREPAAHQTGRNSCVIHSGVYYAPGSLKAKLCVEGRRRLLELLHRAFGSVRDLRKGDRRRRALRSSRDSTSSSDAGSPTASAVCDASGRSSSANLSRTAPASRHSRFPRPDSSTTASSPMRSGAWVQSRGGSVVAVARLSGRSRRRPGTCSSEPTSGEVRASFVIGCAGLQADRLIKLNRRPRLRRDDDRAVSRRLLRLPAGGSRSMPQPDLPGSGSALSVPRRPRHPPP